MIFFVVSVCIWDFWYSFWSLLPIGSLYDKLSTISSFLHDRSKKCSRCILVYLFSSSSLLVNLDVEASHELTSFLHCSLPLQLTSRLLVRHCYTTPGCHQSILCSVVLDSIYLLPSRTTASLIGVGQICQKSVNVLFVKSLYLYWCTDCHQHWRLNNSGQTCRYQVKMLMNVHSTMPITNTNV